MDENTNDSDKQPEVVMPGGGDGEASEAPSAPEIPETENSPEKESTNTSSDADAATDNGSDAPEEGGSEESDDTDSSEDNASETPSIPESEEKPDEPEASDEHSADNADKAPETTETETPSADATPSEETKSPETSPTSVPDETPASSPAPSVTPPAPTLPADDTPTPSTQNATAPVASDKKKVNKIISVVVVVVVLALVVIIVALFMGNKNAPSINDKITSNVSAPKIDTWTGKANTYDWDTAMNWSLGIPANGESLAINTASIKQTSSPVTFQDNIPSLSISRLTIDGTSADITITGSPINIKNGIAVDLTQANTDSTKPAVQINNALTFTGNQTVNAATGNDLTLSGASSATTTIGSNTVQFVAAKSSDIEVSTPLVGTGEIELPTSTATTGVVDFNTASPSFTGEVMVSSGATVGMSNQNTSGSGVNTTDAFGTAAITVASGGYLELNEVGSTSFTVPNNLTIAGNGGASQSQDNGAYTGAISSCITSAQQGCSSGATVTFSGKVTLTANAELGAFYGLNTPQVPTSTTVTYVVKNLATSSHTLTAVPSSKAVVELPTKS